MAEAARRPAAASEGDTERTLRRWREVLPEDRMAHLVKDAMRAFHRALQMRLAEHEVSLGHWPFLRVLWETDGLTQRELSRETGVMEPTTFSAVQAMERRGYVVRRQLADNRRNVHVFLTARGRALERKLVPLAEEVNRIAIGSASAAAVATTRRTLLTMLANLAADEQANDSAHRRVPSTRELGRLVEGAACKPASKRNDRRRT
jgi:DNA-binding MarR family transcriptional regulator